MFKNKGVKTIEKPYVVKPKVANPSIHMVDVNMAITRNKVTEEHVFKDRTTETKRPQVLVCYDLLKGLIDEDEHMIFETELELFQISTIIILDETISLLSNGMSKV
jgi:hypothetical protein